MTSKGGLTLRNKRKVFALRDHLAALLPKGAKVLDVGCGDGALAYSILQTRPDVEIQGIDLVRWKNTTIRIDQFDGQSIPYDDATFDVVMFVNVLHHTEDPTVLLREAKRVTRKSILLKDHTRDGLFADATLRFMDWVGNIGLGIPLPYEFWPRRRWIETFDGLGLRVSFWNSDLHLYPWPASLLFDRSLHFVAQVDLT
jgi:SAM-dependent methyltransferase